MFDEFTADAEKDDNLFNLCLTHNKSSRSTDNKVACMDKILDDMRKKYELETEQKQNSSADELLFLVGDKFEETETYTESETINQEKSNPTRVVEQEAESPLSIEDQVKIYFNEILDLNFE